ncbi:RagB/SusD family nutrient uptake outer membrane protein [Chryseobacterium sp. MEBOG07]|uniref:RagB/SusD family nutrient uptake outer membrane protein n=1 Tax=Chryseobacterium sp. MEBOG07 TaxID=2879939 RepID=UPI001F3A3CA4|nr:RagB/SusD family nutrient uptake outer membrane protein [Chryseobacterium sp. MEBOG07]UKB78592.1 RagB/SusD family nutrient uptake outer membrane protein [Chryseobacterium sp. MEBOG07]
MKTIKILLISILLFLLKICISCEKLVEVEIPNNQITTGQVFEDVQTANAALAGLYAGMRDNSPIAGNQAGELFGTYTDDLDCYATTSTNGVYDLYRNQQISANPIIYSYWSGAYQNIYIANAIIEGVENSPALPAVEKNRIKGEALLMRAILYFYLQQIFGDIPYPVTTNYQINQTLSKTTSSEILTHLESGLSQAANLLTDDYRNAERIYPNKKTAQLMLAKIYMIQYRWNDAELVLKNIVQSPLYQLENNTTKVFQKSGPHILWQLKPKNPNDPTKEAMNYYFTSAAPTNYALSQDLVSSFSNGDLRKQNWMTTVTFNGTTWYRADKYKNRTNNTNEYSIVFRLEEAYLLLAEALVQQNKLQEALPFINTTRQRAGLSALTNPSSQSALLGEIVLENRKEFFTEMGHRFLDLKRTNRLNTLIMVKPNWKSYHDQWPLPQQELLLNSNLNPQNTGY